MKIARIAAPLCLLVVSACGSSSTSTPAPVAPTPAPPSVAATFAVPAGNPYMQGLTAGPDGNLWLTETTNKIARLTPTGVFTEFAVPTASSELGGITAGPDGNLWFAEGAGKVGSITPSGVITEFPVTSEQPVEIVTGPDGRLWFTDYTFEKIGAITTAGAVTLYPLPSSSSFPTGITKGADANMWACARGGGIIDRITPSGTVTEFPIPGAEGCDSLVTGSDGNVYFSPVPDGNGTHIGRITPSGAFSFIQTSAIGTPPHAPRSLVLGKDGAIYFGMYGNAKTLGRVSPAGVESEYQLGSSTICALGAGGDGSLYAYDCDAKAVVKVSY